MNKNNLNELVTTYLSPFWEIISVFPRRIKLADNPEFSDGTISNKVF